MNINFPVVFRASSHKRASCVIYFEKVVCPKAHTFLLDLFSAYSVPVPRDWKQVLLLISLCFIISSVAGLLLYLWLYHSLQYNSVPATVLSIMSAFLICGTLVLVHPIRCILTILLPTLGTKQGRRILLSTTFMIMALHIIPNILKNLRTVFRIIRCISQHSTEMVLNSTNTFQELTKEVKNIVNSMGLIYSKELNFYANVNNSVVSHQILELADKMKNDFQMVETLFRSIMLETNRVVAAFFVLYMILNATWYLRNYLTDIKFDNRYITKQLEQLAQNNNTADLTNSCSLKLIKSTGFKMSREEVTDSIFRLMTALLFVLLSLLIVTMDHIVFRVSIVVAEWVNTLPALQGIFYLTYNVHINNIHIKLKDIIKEFPLNVTFFSANCKHPTSPPDSSITIGIAFIYCILFAVIFLEAYAHRLCRKISAMFYGKREEERVLYLFNQIQQNQNHSSSPVAANFES